MIGKDDRGRDCLLGMIGRGDQQGADVLSGARAPLFSLSLRIRASFIRNAHSGLGEGSMVAGPIGN